MTSAPSPGHKALVVQEFTRQAQAYTANQLIASADRLTALVQLVQPRPGSRVLDVATGPGYVAAAFAEAGCEVTGLDLTPALLERAEQMRQARGLSGLRFLEGDAEQLPFEERTFDIVVSRFALHHWERPRRVLAEMARVARLGGMVVIQDLVTSEFPARSAYQNRFERLRDPSHVRALPLSELLALFTACGLEVRTVTTSSLVQDVAAWLANARTPPARASAVRALLDEDERHDLSGTSPVRGSDHQICSFEQRVATLLGRRLSTGTR